MAPSPPDRSPRSLSRRSLLLGSVATTGAAATAVVADRVWSHRTTARRRRVVASAGPQRSVYLGWMTSLAEQVGRDFPALTMDVRRSSGSVENLGRLWRGEVQLAVAATDAATLAARGLPPFAGTVPVAAIARVYDDYMHLIVRDDSGIAALTDLAGRRVAVGPAGSGTMLVAQRLLTYRNLQVEQRDLDVVEAGLALQARSVDAVFWLGGLPTRAVSELADRVRIRLLPLADAAVGLRGVYGAAYRLASIPASTYRPVEAVPTVASANLLLCRDDAPDDLVEATVRTLFRRRDEIAAAQPAGNALDVRAAIATVPIPLHPAAAGYYRSGKP